MTVRMSGAMPEGGRNGRAWLAHGGIHVPGQLELPLEIDRKLDGVPAEEPDGNAGQQRPEINEER